MEFLITIGGDLTGMEGEFFKDYSSRVFLILLTEFPREPTGYIKREISDEANRRLMFYLPLSPEEEVPQPGIEIPPRPQLPDNVTDAPLVRLFNFPRMRFSKTSSPR